MFQIIFSTAQLSCLFESVNNKNLFRHMCSRRYGYFLKLSSFSANFSLSMFSHFSHGTFVEFKSAMFWCVLCHEFLSLKGEPQCCCWFLSFWLLNNSCIVLTGFWRESLSLTGEPHCFHWFCTMSFWILKESSSVLTSFVAWVFLVILIINRLVKIKYTIVECCFYKTKNNIINKHMFAS